MKVLRNNGKRRLGIPGRPAIILSPGDSVPVTDAQVIEMRKNKTVERWLDRGVLKLTDSDEIEMPSKKVLPEVRRGSRASIGANDKREQQVLPKGITGEGVEMHHRGGGWYEVYVSGFKVTDSNVRKDEAQEIATEYE